MTLNYKPVTLPLQKCKRFLHVEIMREITAYMDVRSRYKKNMVDLMLARVQVL